MCQEGIKEVIDEILKSRDVLSAITSGSIAAPASHEQPGHKLLTRDDVRNECESVKLDAAKGVLLMRVFFLSDGIQVLRKMENSRPVCLQTRCLLLTTMSRRTWAKTRIENMRNT